MNGLSTLNRLLGKRNKDVSKSTSNLSRSTTNLDSSSQYNKIVPLAAMTNAPFEQTFRITVLLPREQLYVTRIGAKTRLSVLLDMVCSDKLLDPQKYLFRHPADFHQGFELDLTIGEVGLNEIRLISKKELENLRNNEYRLSTSDIFRLHQKNIRENSVSSSDLSRTSRAALKTTSPYSSTNSLNSMDSSGLSSSSRGGLNGTNHHPPVAPTRKKRMAPRPPSQNSIPEKSPLEIHKDDHIFKEPQLPPYSRKNFHVSSPNLYNGEVKVIETLVNNNNNNNNGYIEQSETNGNGHHVVDTTVEEMNNLINTKTSYSTLKNRPTSMYIIREPPAEQPPEDSPHPQNDGNLQRTSLNGTNGTSVQDIVNHSRTSSNSSEVKDPRDFQEGPHPTPSIVPTPRKRLNSNAKKSKAPAPAPPPRGVSLKRDDQPPPSGGLMATTLEPKIVPTPSPRAPIRAAATPIGDDAETIISGTDSNFSETDAEIQKNRETVNKLNAVNSAAHQPQTSTSPSLPSPNVSKVMLNVDQSASLTSTEAPSSLSPEAERKPSSGASSVSITIVNEPSGGSGTPNGYSSKPSTPIISKVHIVPPSNTAVNGSDRDSSEEPVDRRHSNGGGNSSDEDIKIYNIESGKETRVLPEKKDALRSPSPDEEEQWTYTLPAPPKFADSSIKSGEYDEKQRFFDLQSTFVDNTTIVTDRMTVISDETEKIRPIIREKVLMDESLGEIEEKCASPTGTLVESEGGNSSVTTGEIMINSDIEDGYRGGSELRETMLQTLEKRREKLKESELQDLKESIEGVMVEQRQADETEEEEANESDIMKCAKLNEETVVDDYTIVVKRSSVVSVVTRSQSVVEQPAIESRKCEMISELSQVIKDENGLKAVLNGKKPAADEEDIPGANNNSNFKISSYIGENKEIVVEKPSEVVVNGTEAKTVSAPVSAKSDDSEEENNVVVRRKISADSIPLRKLSSDEEETGTRFSNNKNQQGPVKRRSLTVLNKSPKNINRSDSFHSTRSDYIQSLASAGGLRLTPRSTSYISLIGAQKFENRFASSNRRKSTSEMSICDSPSLQSLEVIKNILNSSRSNLSAVEKQEVQEAMPMAAIKRNSFTDISTLVQFKSEVVRSNLVRRESMVEQKIEEVESKKVFEEELLEKPMAIEKIELLKESLVDEPVDMKATDSEKAMNERVIDVSNESKSDDEKLKNRQLSAAIAKQPQTTVVNITTTSTTVASSGVSVTVNAENGDPSAGKRWTYQGPPTINFTTWSERPKIDVSIKSDRDYRFGGSSTLPRGYRNVNNTTKVNLNATPAPTLEQENGVDQPDSREHVPLNNGEPHSLPQDTNPSELVSVTTSDRLPIVRAVEYKKNVVPPPPVAQKPLEKPYFYDTYSRTPANSTTTINRLSMGFNKFQPVVRGFKPMDEKDTPARVRPVSMIESTNISTAILKTTPTRIDKPAAPEPVQSLPFGQNTLRRTGLKDKILAQSNPEPTTAPAKAVVQEAPIVAVKAAASTATAPLPPPPPVAPKLTTPVVRGAIVKRPLPPLEVDPRSALLDAIRNFNKDNLRTE